MGKFQVFLFNLLLLCLITYVSFFFRRIHKVQAYRRKGVSNENETCGR